MNYCEEDGFHAIKLMAEVYLREIKMKDELIIGMEMSTFFSGVNFFICSSDSGKF